MARNENDWEKKMKEKKNVFDRIVTIILLLVCIALAVGIYMKSGQEKEIPQMKAAVQEQTSVNVSAAAAEIGTFINTTKTNGEITSADSDIGIYPDASGKIVEILVKKGDMVKQGDIIAYVDPSKPGSQYQKSPVVSTTEGMVREISATVGETVGTTTQIATVTGNKTLIVSTKISERNLGTIRTGLPGTVTVVAYPDKAYPVEISYIAPAVDQATRTVEVELSFTGDTSGLMEGMYASASIVTEQVDGILLIPTEALSTYAGDDVVYVVKDGKAVRQVVELGGSNSSYSVISSGLDEGDMVVVAGNVSDGTAVNIV